jgi:hypothetical protein
MALACCLPITCGQHVNLLWVSSFPASFLLCYQTNTTYLRLSGQTGPLVVRLRGAAHHRKPRPNVKDGRAACYLPPSLSLHLCHAAVSVCLTTHLIHHRRSLPSVFSESIRFRLPSPHPPTSPATHSASLLARHHRHTCPAPSPARASRIVRASPLQRTAKPQSEWLTETAVGLQLWPLSVSPDSECPVASCFAPFSAIYQSCQVAVELSRMYACCTIEYMTRDKGQSFVSYSSSFSVSPLLVGVLGYPFQN